MGKLLKNWELKLFGLCRAMIDAVVWSVSIQLVGDVLMMWYTNWNMPW
jgi:hypothetical protein